jgi:hypothetical protein
VKKDKDDPGLYKQSRTISFMADDDTSHVGHSEYTFDDPNQLDGDNDSTMGESIASSTCSLSPSVAEYEHQHGRRYHAFRAGRYYMPNDEEEQDLMDLVHAISLMVVIPFPCTLYGILLQEDLTMQDTF